MHTYPADEAGLARVERGQLREAVVAMAPEDSLAAGETILFALSASRRGQPPEFVRGGDSVRVQLTGVTDLLQADPATGHPLVRLSW